MKLLILLLFPCCLLAQKNDVIIANNNKYEINITTSNDNHEISSDFFDLVIKRLENIEKQLSDCKCGEAGNGGGIGEGTRDAYGNLCLNTDDEKKFLKENATDARYIANLYNKSNQKRRCYSTQDIARIFGVNDKLSEIKMATLIFEELQK